MIGKKRVARSNFFVKIVAKYCCQDCFQDVAKDNLLIGKERVARSKL